MGSPQYRKMILNLYIQNFRIYNSFFNYISLMKIFAILSVICLITFAVRVPTPSCRVNPLPTLIPITLGQTQRFDLEGLFNGYNLSLTVPNNIEYVTSLDKFTIYEKNFDSSMNFTSAKIFGNGRFLGTFADGAQTILYIGMNSQSDGVTITKTVKVEEVPNTRCFDAQEIQYQNQAYAIIDCATFNQGILRYNEFYYVNLATFEITQGRRFTDVFVHYTKLSKRQITTQYDPMNNITYMYRAITRDAVDQEHYDETYIEIFEISDGLNPYLIDVIDHTIFEQKSLSIADFQIYEGLIYILNYNKGLYEIRYTGNQKIEIRSVFRIQMDVSKFRVSRLGFNDDINVVFTNGNSIYQYDWVIGKQPVLTAKYSLMPNSIVQYMFVDQNFVIVSAKSYFTNATTDIMYRKIWSFSKFTTSYTNVFTSIDLPQTGNMIMHFHEHLSVLTVFGDYATKNIKFLIPFILINPLRPSLIYTYPNITISATSIEGDASVNCTSVLSMIVNPQTDRNITTTGVNTRSQYVVDSPDIREWYVGWNYFGPFLNYQIKVNTQDPNSRKPTYQVQKIINNTFNWQGGPNLTTIKFIEMFQILNLEGLIYGFVQDAANVLYYISCQPKTDHTLNCKTIITYQSPNGKILRFSQAAQRNARVYAVVYESDPHLVFLFVATPYGIGPYGQVRYTGVFQNQLTAISVNNGLLFLVFQIGKRVDIYKLDDINGNPSPKPLFRITSQVMRFFGVPYFAPVDCQTSQYHGETLFLKTKTGLMALGINELGFPSMLFQIAVVSDYSYEISRDTILIIQKDTSSLYRLQTPVRRNANPILLQTFQDTGFNIGYYSELVSDQLFYVVSSGNIITIIHPNRPSTSVYFDVVASKANVIALDAVRFGGRQYLFSVDRTGFNVWEIYFEPRIEITWQDNQVDFQLQLSAKNNYTLSDTEKVKFTVFNLSQSSITPTDFDQKKVDSILAFPNPYNNKNPVKQIQFQDRNWFNGSILRYRVDCPDCGKNIMFQNHIHQGREILAARAVFDIKSTHNGVYAQQYDAVFKTYLNDSIQHISQIPTTLYGEACVKIAIAQNSFYAVSLCQTGTAVDLYLTSYVTQKPFTYGYTQSQATQVNFAKMIGPLLIIVDNQDNPFVRAGGIYIYHINLDIQDEQPLSLLDIIQSDDLQIDGFDGMAFISSADFHKPSYNDTHYRLVLTQARTGGVFLFTFEVSADQQEIIYISKSFIDVHKCFSDFNLIPEPLRIYSVSILSFYTNPVRSEYRFLLTVANWHHIELLAVVDQTTDDVISVKVDRLYERYPWQLVNYVQYKEGRFGFFAVPYINRTLGVQVVAVYDTSGYNPADYYIPNLPYPIPVTRLLGSHWIRDIYEVSYDFNDTNTFGYDNIIFVDVDAYNFTELKLSRNLTVKYQNVPKNQTLKFIAENTFHSVNFTMQFGIIPIPTNEQTVQIIWIIILALGGVMIIGLLIVLSNQLKREKQLITGENKESLITRDSTFQNAFINRSSVDPGDTPAFRESRENEKLKSTELKESEAQV